MRGAHICAESQMLNELEGLELAARWKLQAHLLPAGCASCHQKGPCDITEVLWRNLVSFHTLACCKIRAECEKALLCRLEIHFWVLYVVYKHSSRIEMPPGRPHSTRYK